MTNTWTLKRSYRQSIDWTVDAQEIKDDIDYQGNEPIDFSDESVLTLPIVNRTSEHYFRASGHDYSGENGARSY